MNSALMFVLAVLAIAAILILLVFKSPKAALAYFRTPGGKQARTGILLFVGIGVLAVLIAEQARGDTGRWFAYGELYLGIDHALKQSPQCERDGPDDKWTSNGGLRVNVFQSGDRRFEVNGKYTHHSCAFNVDRNLYDAVGVEATYRLW